jgi:hypothetical protein
MKYLLIYLGIGCLLSLYFASYYFISRKNLSKPISEKELLGVMLFCALLWPLCVKTIFSKNIEKLASVSKPFFPDLNESYETRMKELKELWDSPPLCGQQVFARGGECSRIYRSFISLYF